MDSIIHFEIPANNIKRAQQFYEKAFDWRMNHMKEMNYTIMTTTASGKKGPTKPGAINGGMMRRNGIVTGPVVTVNVKDIEKSMKAVSRLGGRVLKGKMPVGNMGYSAYVKDTEGNIIGLWQHAK